MTTFFAMALSLFFIFNPIGNTPVFVGLLASFDEQKQRKIITRELLIALFILLLFNFFGDGIMDLLGISPPVLGVAGGTLLFLIAISMIFPKERDQKELKQQEPLIVPLAIPLIAGPGTISIIMVYSEQLQNNWLSAVILIAAWIPTFIILLLSSRIKRLLGDRGLVAFQRLGGMIIALISVQMICSGVTSLLRTALYVPK